MTTVNIDVDTLASEPVPLVLSSGLTVLVERLKTRQMMRLMKILTRGAGSALSSLRVGEDSDISEFAGQLLATVVFSIPEAEDETIDFVRCMVTPANLIVSPRTTEDREANEARLAALDAEFENPEIEDLVTVLEQVITVEAPHLVALGKRLALLIKTQQKSQDAKRPKTSSKATSAT